MATTAKLAPERLPRIECVQQLLWTQDQLAHVAHARQVHVRPRIQIRPEAGEPQRTDVERMACGSLCHLLPRSKPRGSGHEGELCGDKSGCRRVHENVALAALRARA